MKRNFFILLFSVLLAGTALGQSLADAARDARKSKSQTPASKVYDNDSLPSSSPITVGATSVPETSAKGDAKGKGEQEAPKDKKQQEADLRAGIAEQKKTIAQLEKEIDLAQREWRMRGAVYYSDAGTKLRDPKKFMDEQRKSEGELKAKQDQLQTAKDKLEQMQEQARRAGIRVE